MEGIAAVRGVYGYDEDTQVASQNRLAANGSYAQMGQLCTGSRQRETSG